MLAHALRNEQMMNVGSEPIAKANVFGQFHPQDTHSFPEFNSSLAALNQAAHTQATDDHMLGRFRYGNQLNPALRSKLAKAHQSALDLAPHVGFMNQARHDILATQWWHFIRSGTPQNYALAQVQTQAVLDWMTVWAHDNAALIGLQRGPSLYPWSHISPLHSLNRGLMYSYLLTGNPVAKKAAMLMADAALKDYDKSTQQFGALPQESDAQAAQPLHRHTAMWQNLMVGWQLSGKPKYLEAIHGFANTLSKTLQSPALPTVGVESLASALVEYLRLFEPKTALLTGTEALIKRQLKAVHKDSALTSASRVYGLLAWGYFNPKKITLAASEKLGLLMPYYWLKEAVSTTEPSAEMNTFLPQTAGPLLSAVRAFEDAHPELDTPEKREAAVTQQWQLLIENSL